MTRIGIVSTAYTGEDSTEMFNKLNSGLNGYITNALNEAKAYTCLLYTSPSFMNIDPYLLVNLE